jgi:hypothetical protein
MNIELIYPVFAQVTLTFVLLVFAGTRRYFAVAGREVKVSEIVLGQRNWPKSIQQLGNALNNQWETPTLFFAAIGFALIAGAQSPVLVTLAWTWVGLRVLHAAIYVTVNNLRFRFLSFIAGVLVLAAFWVVFALEVMSR